MPSADPPLIVRAEHPPNAGTPITQLARFITPITSFFQRNHASIPNINPATYHLTIDGLVNQQLQLTLADLQRFARHTLISTLQCAGNRRTEMNAYKTIGGEIIWDFDAISTAEWSGVRLADVISAAHPQALAAHVAFTGLDHVEKEGETFAYGGSIDLRRALTNDVLIADKMNGQSLPAEHGYPLRIIVPGVIGARSVKWLSHIRLQAEPSDNYFQTNAYKLFPSHSTRETVDWSQGLMLDATRLNSVILDPQNGVMIPQGDYTIRGYAVGSEGSAVTKVQISLDNGASWREAQMEDRAEKWAWRFWQFPTTLSHGDYQLWVRAEDSSGATQPANVEAVWNFLGYMNNVWHKVDITVR
ncbi:MAG: molybdopterin-dependent oxidoreductase [Anaerolineae bacterium]|nr:molybdopterin-dependent oxidoreductase [Anaerolineae bacterium]